MKIYTKTGDKGTTALLGGTRVSKAHLRLEAYGTVDELNAYIGLVSDQEVNSARRGLLKQVQDRLFTIGANLAAAPGKEVPRMPGLQQADIAMLEEAIDEMEEELPPLKNFILPGGHQAVSFCHVARTVCRRAERHVVHLNETEEVDEMVIRFLNRLSDYLFVLARKMGKELGAGELSWIPGSEK
jgi:cob(I)alamin adenosyltransferase